MTQEKKSPQEIIDSLKGPLGQIQTEDLGLKFVKPLTKPEFLKGPPGHGKTSTHAEAVKSLAEDLGLKGLAPASLREKFLDNTKDSKNTPEKPL